MRGLWQAGLPRGPLKSEAMPSPCTSSLCRSHLIHQVAFRCRGLTLRSSRGLTCFQERQCHAYFSNQIFSNQICVTICNNCAMLSRCGVCRCIVAASEAGISFAILFPQPRWQHPIWTGMFSQQSLASLLLCTLHRVWQGQLPASIHLQAFCWRQFIPLRSMMSIVVSA